MYTLKDSSTAKRWLAQIVIKLQQIRIMLLSKTRSDFGEVISDAREPSQYNGPSQYRSCKYETVSRPSHIYSG